ncbi:HNH endonuclease [Methylocystis sp. S23]
MCGAPATIVDHIEPHKGDKALFWRHDNHQALCISCHSSRKQSQERRNAQ